MKKIVAVEAVKLQQPKWYPVALALAVIVTIATTAILFFLDSIIESIEQHGLGASAVSVTLLTATAGVFALPYLLRLTLSALMRVVSFFALFIAIGGWMLGAWWLEINTSSIYASSALIFAYVALIMAFCSVWSIGLPFQPLKKKR